VERHELGCLTHTTTSRGRLITHLADDHDPYIFPTPARLVDDLQVRDGQLGADRVFNITCEHGHRTALAMVGDKVLYLYLISDR
jgi:hypothetical protein